MVVRGCWKEASTFYNDESSNYYDRKSLKLVFLMRMTTQHINSEQNELRYLIKRSEKE